MIFLEYVGSRACLSARYSYKERRDLRVSPFLFRVMINVVNYDTFFAM